MINSVWRGAYSGYGKDRRNREKGAREKAKVKRKLIPAMVFEKTNPICAKADLM